MPTTSADHQMRLGHHRGPFPGPGLYRATCGCGWKAAAHYGAARRQADAIEAIELAIAVGTNTACCLCAEISTDLLGHGISRHGGKFHDTGDGGACRTCGEGALVLPGDLVARSAEQGHRHGLFEACGVECERLPVELWVEVLVSQKGLARC